MEPFVNCQGQIGRAVVFYDDFSNGFNPNLVTSPYQFIKVPIISYTSNDGTTSVTPDGDLNTLSISSVPFTKTSNTEVYDRKYFAISRGVFVPPIEGEEMVFETICSAEQTGLASLPNMLKATLGSLDGVSNANSDLRLAAAYLLMLDPVNWMEYGFTITNETIYAIYSRSPDGMVSYGGTLPNYHSHTSYIPVGKRDLKNPIDDYVKLAIAYNYKFGYVRWIVNDIEVYRVTRLGYPIDRKYRVFQTNPNLGDSIQRSPYFISAFGTANSAYMTNPENPGSLSNEGLIQMNTPIAVNPVVTDSLGDALPLTYVTTYGTSPLNGTLFGQGARMNLKYFSIYLLDPDSYIPTLISQGAHTTVPLVSETRQDAINGVNSMGDLFLQQSIGSIPGYPVVNFPQDKTQLYNFRGV